MVVLRCRTVADFVVTVEDDKGALLRKQVNGCRVGIGNICTVQPNRIFLVAKDGEPFDVVPLTT